MRANRATQRDVRDLDRPGANRVGTSDGRRHETPRNGHGFEDLSPSKPGAREAEFGDHDTWSGLPAPSSVEKMSAARAALRKTVRNRVQSQFLGQNFRRFSACQGIYLWMARPTRVRCMSNQPIQAFLRALR